MGIFRLIGNYLLWMKHYQLAAHKYIPNVLKFYVELLAQLIIA